mmetsp:Transcript_88020/g.284194  ORF Transcript_88020/g.284194 Transcript_88020/m.284194 type:complete len:84 (+) Transcript_88020:825-1076(+)
MHLCSAVNRFENYHTASRAGEIGEMIRQEDNVPLSTCKHCVSKAGAGFRNQFFAKASFALALAWSCLAPHCAGGYVEQLAGFI